MNDNQNKPTSVDLKSGEAQLLLDHNYDGIRELDHLLPKWWLGILYATIIFAAWYVGYYMILSGPSPKQELFVALKEIEALNPKPAPTSNEASQVAYGLALKDPKKLVAGGAVFTAKCVACHADKGQGLIGPNLTDDFWISGKGTLTDIADVVVNGVLDKGMPPWGPILTADELVNVVAFVRSIRGSSPANPKAPQGEKQESKD